MNPTILRLKQQRLLEAFKQVMEWDDKPLKESLLCFQAMRKPPMPHPKEGGASSIQVNDPMVGWTGAPSSVVAFP